MDNSQYLELFIEETNEHLEIISESLIRLEQDKDDKGIINEIFRAAHTIKGMAGAMGFDRMSDLTHGMEDVLQDIREDKLKVDTKLINLLFICHDFLENSLQSIMRNGSEGTAAIDQIMNKLHGIIEERHEDIISTKEEVNQIVLAVEDSEEADLTGDIEFLERINMSIKSGMNIYNVSIELDESCSFKSVRAFMIYQFFEETGEIIRSEPDSEGIKDGSLEFNSVIIKAVFATTESKDFIEKAVYSVSEIRNVTVNTIEEIQENAAKEIIEDSTKRVIDINREFLDDCKLEISEQISALKSTLEETDSVEIKKELVYLLFRGFHTIKGLADFIEFKLVSKIAGETEKFLSRCGKEECSMKRIKELVAGSTNFISNLCEDIKLEKDSEFLDFVNLHLSNFTGNISEYKDNAVIEAHQNQAASVNGPIDTSHDMKKSGSAEGGLIRIPANRVDALVELSGELLILQSQMEQEMEGELTTKDSFSSIITKMSRITKNLQNLTMLLQMVSLKTTFQKLNRIARDTIKELNKDADFKIVGEETEIDRQVAEKLLEPLMHLVKNAISHGIESREERVSMGKALRGIVEVHAYSKRDSVYIEVRDDGGGIHLDKVYSKALEKGLIDASKSYTDQEITNLIFLPGFSTAETVNSISGRGVGMDAVRAQITRIGGKVEVESSRGKGSIFKLKIPISSSAMNGTIVNIMDNQYVIPTLSIKSIVNVKEEQWINIKGARSMMRLRDKIIPVIDVSQLLMVQEESADAGSDLVIVIEYEQELRALPVKSIIGRKEIVVRPLGEEFNNTTYITGATILGDGRVVLILDIENLFVGIR